MKSIVLLKFIVLFSLNAVLGQSNGQLLLQGDKLKGKCVNKYYTGFVIELDSTYTKIDSTTLFSQFPRIGSINFKNKVIVPTEFTITERAGFKQIMFRFRSDYLTFDNLNIDNQSISFTIDNNPKVPAIEQDLEIIRLAISLLSEENNWNKNDDRKCADDLINQKYSLYCALRLSSLEIEEKYNHRNAVLQKLRYLIKEKFPNKTWSHKLMDFNNMEETKYVDIVNILNEIEQDFILELSAKNEK